MSNKLTITFRAGDCTYFKTKHPSKRTTWEDQGLLPFARAPKEFRPNLQKLARASSAIEHIGQALTQLDASQSRILLNVLHDNMLLDQNHGLRFGQPMYINLSSPHADYLDCWYRVFVVAPSEEHPDYVYVSGSLSEDIEGTLMLVPVENLKDTLQFKGHVVMLRSLGKLVAPKQSGYVNTGRVPEGEPDIPDAGSQVAIEELDFSEAVEEPTSKRPKKRVSESLHSKNKGGSRTVSLVGKSSSVADEEDM